MLHIAAHNLVVKVVVVVAGSFDSLQINGAIDGDRNGDKSRFDNIISS